MVWTHFWDMHSGGGSKEKWEHIYIEAPIDEAKVIFYNRFGHNPERVSCTCCGSDYAIDEVATLAQATGYQRGCAASKRTGKYLERAPRPGESSGTSSDGYEPMAKYILRKDVKVIFAKDIKKSERVGEVPEQGFVWR